MTWQHWLDRLTDSQIGDPIVYDRWGNEAADPYWHLTTPSDKAILATLADEPTTDDDEEEAACAICHAIGCIMQLEQNQIDQEAEEAELQEWLAKEAALNDLHDLVSEALSLDSYDDWHHAASGSRYATYHGLSIRVADHRQVAGGGWNEVMQCRSGDCEVDLYLIDRSHDWTCKSIRDLVAEALQDERSAA